MVGEVDLFLFSTRTVHAYNVVNIAEVGEGLGLYVLCSSSGTEVHPGIGAPKPHTQKDPTSRV